MKKILNYKATKVIALVLCAVLPCALTYVIALVNGPIADFLGKNIYNLLWCGLYGCILVCLTFKRIYIKVAAVALNLLPFAFLALGALMGGIFAPFALLLKAIVPFMPL